MPHSTASNRLRCLRSFLGLSIIKPIIKLITFLWTHLFHPCHLTLLQSQSNFSPGPTSPSLFLPGHISFTLPRSFNSKPISARFVSLDSYPPPPVHPEESVRMGVPSRRFRFHLNFTIVDYLFNSVKLLLPWCSLILSRYLFVSVFLFNNFFF